MRIPGLGGRVVAKAGTSVVLTPGGEIYAALERGVIDATEWVGPHDDMKLGLQNTARYYYYPGWHSRDSGVRLQPEGLRGLPVDLKQILDLAAAASRFTAAQYHEERPALERSDKYKGKVELVQFPAPVCAISEARPRSSGAIERRDGQEGERRSPGSGLARPMRTTPRSAWLSEAARAAGP
jgi:TRAP-type mannitol/chloroaromatic compound transport system substrate-binding protein